jgi:hypothetical protein
MIKNQLNQEDQLNNRAEASKDEFVVLEMKRKQQER